MRYYKKISLLVAVMVLGLVAVPAQAQLAVGSCEQALGEAFLDINNVRARILNNGNLFWRGSPHVYNVPKGGPSNAIFASGIWMGGQVNGVLRLAGSTYGPYEFWAGPIDDSGSPACETSGNQFDRVWKVSKEDVINFEGTGVATPDLQDWPTGLGAPTLDADGNMINMLEDENGNPIPLAQRIDRKINLAGGERPGILGDQMLWWIMNDLGNTHNRTDGAPMGVEVHAQAFAFNTSGAIGNTTFYKYNVFYKGNQPLTDTYMGIFSDPDLGNFDDDYVGSDTTLGMGYVYNADNDDEGGEGYGSPVPATGYDFFQGPLVNDDGVDNDGDGVVDNDNERLKMTAFVYYNNGGGVQGDPANAIDMYNYMQGRWLDGQRVTFGGDGRNFSNIPTSFMYTGSPSECGGGGDAGFWTECNSDGAGSAIAPADRRFVMATGPFTIKPGDSQEIVFGVVWSKGADNLDSVAKMKADDALAQAVFDIDFQLPPPPAAPRVETTVMDGRVILEWGYRPTDNNYLNSYNVDDPLLSDDITDRDYQFEGYIVKQFTSLSDQDGKILAVYDKANGVTRIVEGTELTFVSAEGTDRGIQTTHVIDGLTNYQTYHFGIQAYAYNATSNPKAYLGPLQRVTVVPTRSTALDGGTTLSDAAIEMAASRSGADIMAEKDGVGGGFVEVDVINPARVTGDSYRVEFFEVCDEETGKRGPVADQGDEGEIDASRLDASLAKTAAACATTYDIINTTTNAKVFDGAEAFAITGEGAPQGSDVLVIDGLAWSIAGPAADFLCLEGGGGGIPGPCGTSGGDYAIIEVQTPGGGDPCGAGAASTFGCDLVGGNNVWHSLNGDATYFISANSGAASSEGSIRGYAPHDFEIRVTAEGSYGIHPFTTGNALWTPVEVWDIGAVGPFGINDPSDDVQMILNIFSDGGGECEFEYGEATDNTFGFPSTDRIYAYYASTTYADFAATAEPLVMADPNGCPNLDTETGGAIWGQIDFGRGRPLQRQSIGDFAGTGTLSTIEGAIIRFLTTKPNLPGDVFTFSTDGLGSVTGDATAARAALDEIGITPNPYKGASSYEVSQLVDQVRFTNMPQQATIRVFTLNGTLIRTLTKNSPQAFFTWDLTTSENLPIASGMYLVHVEVPGLGEKVIKFGVVKKRVQLNTF